MILVQVLEEARRDIEDTTLYYQDEAGDALAGRFVDAVEKSVLQLSKYPKSGAIRFRAFSDLPELRIWPITGFPYYILYRETADQLLIVRILHAQRDIPAILRRDLP